MLESIKYLAVAMGMAIILTGCGDSDQETDPVNVRFLLTDMPGDYEQVNIEVEAVQIMINDTLLKLDTHQGIYNLLEFVNGKDTMLVDESIPAGFVSQIRLVLGDDNSVMIGDQLNDLETPSDQQSGLKLNVHEDLIPGESYSYVIDFEVEKSIVETGNKDYILKPVIRIFTEAVTGSIKGIVSPAQSQPLVMAVRDDDVVSTTADPVTGEFMIRGLYEGGYVLEFQPEEGFRDTLLNGVVVMPGQETVLETMFIK